MTILTLPSSPAFRHSSFKPHGNTAAFVSPRRPLSWKAAGPSIDQRLTPPSAIDSSSSMMLWGFTRSKPENLASSQTGVAISNMETE